MSFFSELKRRNVFRVAAAYIVSSWLLIQVAETIFPLFGFGDDPARMVVIILAFGFIPALIISWAFELTPGGWQRESDVDHKGEVASDRTRRFDRIVIVVLALGIAYFAFDKFVLSGSREAMIAESARDAALAEARQIIDANPSIAVLPFVDMSPGQDQGYFVDGVSEEILNILGSLDGLNTIGRTSSFRFRNPQQDLKEIGEQLGVSYILEGTIRKYAEEVEVTARLVDAQTGLQIFPYERRDGLHDLFDIQEQIARDVAGALSIRLDIEGRGSLPGARTDNIDAYDIYLRATSRRPDARKDVTRKELLELALEIDPNYVEAMSGLGGWYGAVYSWTLPPDEAREAQEYGRSLVQQAHEIDPTYPGAVGNLARYQWARGDWIGATELWEQYSALVPANIPGRLGSANILGKVGRTRAALQIDELQRDLDPLNFFAASNRVEHYAQAGRFVEAEAELDLMVRLTSESDQAVRLRRMLIAFGRNDRQEIRDALALYAEENFTGREDNAIREVIRKFDSAAGPEFLDVLRSSSVGNPGLPGEAKLILASMAVHLGDSQLALDIFGPEVRGNKVRIGRLWYPHFSDMRRLDGFKELARDVGFVDYWRKYEWADHCRPLGDDDFECE